MMRPTRLLRPFGPVVARPGLTETLRAAAGSAAGLLLAGFLTMPLSGPVPADAPFLIAPLGATAMLVFAVPNSPLAQPWSAVVGNLVSALVALALLRLIPDPRLCAGAAVALAIVAMALVRALHPPGAAVALLIALSADPRAPLTFGFAFAPVLLDTAMLVLAGMAWNRATGRKYPFRQPLAETSHGTQDAAPDRRLGLSADELGQILARMNLAANIGVEDLARVIGAAEAEAAAHHLGGLTAGDIMSRDVVTARPDDHPDDLARVFRSRRFKTLPVVDADGLYLGLVAQADLLGPAGGRDEAEQVMTTGSRTAAPETPIAPLLALIADEGQQAVPILDGGRLAGLVTRSDMIAALARAVRAPR